MRHFRPRYARHVGLSRYGNCRHLDGTKLLIEAPVRTSGWCGYTPYMAVVNSHMLPLGTLAPEFVLEDTEGNKVSLSTSAQGSRATLVMFICNHCPFVKHVAAQLARLGRDAQDLGVAVFAINANDADAYPQDGLAAMAVEKRQRGYTFPYLFDATQTVAKSYQAACTPDFFVFDADKRLVYRGQLDDSRPGNDIAVTGKDVRQALEAALRGGPPPHPQRPSVGCNIKWKPGNAPAYFG